MDVVFLFHLGFIVVLESIRKPIFRRKMHPFGRNDLISSFQLISLLRDKGMDLLFFFHLGFIVVLEIIRTPIFRTKEREIHDI